LFGLVGVEIRGVGGRVEVAVIRLRIFLHLRTAALAAALVMVLAAAGAAVWANQTGLPDELRRMIEAELGQRGMHVRLGSLRYVPLVGIVAEDVESFSPEEPGRRLAHIQRVVFDLDLSRLVRGKVRVERVELSDARVVLPTAKGAPDLVIERLNGRIGARVIGNGSRPGGGNENADQRATRRLLLARIAKELARWDFDSRSPPKIRLFVEGELSEPEDLQVTVALESPRLGRAGYELKDVRLDGEIVGGVLSIHSVRAHDETGSLRGRVEYDIRERSGRFVGRSGLDAMRLLHAFFGIRVLEGFDFKTPPKIDIDARFRLPPGKAPMWSVSGAGECGAFSFGGNSFLGAKAGFSVEGHNVYLRDVELRHAKGTATGKVLVRDGKVRYRVKTNVPVGPWRPFFQGKPLGKVLDQIEARPGHSVAVDLDGRSDIHDSHAWSCQGTLYTTGIRYRGVPLRKFRSKVRFDAAALRFNDVSAVFDDTGYPLRRRPGKSAPHARADNVTIDHTAELVRVANLTGTCWPGQVADMFNRKLGQNLARYKFYDPPDVKASGTIDMRPGGARTDFLTDFQLSTGADYRFLGQDVPLESPSGRVHVLGNRVKIENLSVRAFGGKVDGDLVVTDGHDLAGEFHWQRVSLPGIAECYQFGPIKAGWLTGRLKFTDTTAGLADLNGEGVLVLEEGELFQVPIFGPLSSLMNGVLGGAGFQKKKEKIGFQLAREASCTFTIREGQFATGDFHTETPSFSIAGEGTVDLADKTLDMTMRLDARGLYGVITLPLRPFYGFFQFSGTGTLNEPATPLRARPVPGNGPKTLETPRRAPADPGNIPKARPVSPQGKEAPERKRRTPARPMGRP